MFFPVSLVPCPYECQFIPQFSGVNQIPSKILGQFSPEINYSQAVWMSPHELWLTQPFYSTLILSPQALLNTPEHSQHRAKNHTACRPACYFGYFELKNFCNKKSTLLSLGLWAMKVLYGARGSLGQVLCNAVAAGLLQNDESMKATLQRPLSVVSALSLSLCYEKWSHGSVNVSPVVAMGCTLSGALLGSRR